MPPITRRRKLSEPAPVVSGPLRKRQKVNASQDSDPDPAPDMDRAHKKHKRNPAASPTLAPKYTDQNLRTDGTVPEKQQPTSGTRKPWMINHNDNSRSLHSDLDALQQQPPTSPDISSLNTSRPTNEKRAILAAIRRRYRDQDGVIFCSDPVNPDLTVGDFCYEYVREQTIKRFLKTKRTSTRKEAQCDDLSGDD